MEDLIDDGYTSKQILDDLDVNHSFKRSLRWLTDFKKKHGLSPEIRIVAKDDSERWIRDVEECVYKGYTAKELLYKLEHEYEVRMSRMTLYRIMQVDLIMFRCNHC
jgi:hypothetical protein